MEGLNDLLKAANVRKLELTFDHSDREGIDRIDGRDLPEGFGISTVHITESGTAFVKIKRQD